MTTERSLADRVLTEAAARLQAEGLALAGAVQVITERSGRHLCDMDVRVLPDGPLIRISQNLGLEARGCRLDPGALEAAVAEVSSRLDGAEAVILNKFGKHEAEGRGFRATIAEAVMRGLPVVVGLNGLNLGAFEAFAGDAFERLPSEAGAVVAWVRARRARPVGRQSAAADRAAWS
jgi:hypothetical protein